MKLALRFALGLTLFVASCRCPHSDHSAIPGRWQMTRVEGVWLLTDTATGHAWIGRRQTDGTLTWESLNPPVDTK